MPRVEWGLDSQVALALSLVVTLGCFGDRDRPTVPVFGDLLLRSDPEGAEIVIDNLSIGETTPWEVVGIAAGRHEVELIFVAGPAERFTWADTVTVPERAADTLDAALEGGCGSECPFLLDQNRIHCRVTGRGDTCASVFYSTVDALSWPDASGGAYGAGGRLLFAGILGADAGAAAGDTVATEFYDPAWLGRAPMQMERSGGRQTMGLSYWASGVSAGESIRGLAVRQTLVAVDSATAEDVLLLTFEVSNVSADERYRRLYPTVPPGGYTFESLYVGFGLDADIGLSDGDLGTFAPDLDLSFIYDAFFQDNALGEFADQPALVGLTTLMPPAGATTRTFTMWSRQDDWDDANDYGFAWRLLAGRLNAGDPITDHPAPEIGHQATAPNDYRVIEAFGPLRLAPGESFTWGLALLIAEPVPGTYTPGVLVPPGDPTATDRQILSVAGNLMSLATEAPVLWERYRP